MADKGYISAKLNALPSNIKAPLQEAFDYVLDNWRIGTDPKAVNARWYRLTGVTHATANTEFSVRHNLEFTPAQVFECLDLSVINSQLVNLKVTRAADDTRIYLSSPSTSATFTLMVE